MGQRRGSQCGIVRHLCKSTTNFGGFIALQNLLTNGGPLPSAVSISYGESETEDGAAMNSLHQHAIPDGGGRGRVGVRLLGRFGGGGERPRLAVAIHGTNVSGCASTPYNVAVGGTDFGDTAGRDVSTFWSSSNGAYFNSAKSYVPEIPWNDSCGSRRWPATTGMARARRHGHLQCVRIHGSIPLEAAAGRAGARRASPSA